MTHTPDQLLEKCRKAHEWMGQHLEAWEEQKKKYPGRHYKNGNDTAEDAPENHYHDWLSFIEPANTSQHPRVSMGARGPDRIRLQVEGLEVATNQLLRDIQYRRHLRNGPLRDMQFNFAVTMVTLEGLGAPPQGWVGMPDIEERQRPKSYRIPQSWYFEDPYAMDRDGIQYYGWISVHTLEDIEREIEEGIPWDLTVAQGSATSSDKQDENGKDLRGEIRPSDGAREEVWVYNLWDPSKEEGTVEDEQTEKQVPHPGGPLYNGTVYRIPMDGGGMIQPPEPFYGPPSGPLTMWGVYSIPDDPVMTGPLTIVEDQIRNLNRIARAVQQAAVNYKRLIFVNQRNPRVVQAVKNARHDYVVPIRNLQPNDVVSTEMGGPTQTQFVALQDAKDRLDRTASFHETQRGIASSSTATAINEAGQASETRMEGIELAFLEAAQDEIGKFVWYLFNTETVVVPISQELQEDYEIQEAPMLGPDGQPATDEDGQPLMVPADQLIFQGGLADQMSFEQLDIKLDFRSMKRTSRGLDMQMRLEAVDRMMNMAMMAVQLPEGPKWKKMAQSVADAYNDDSLAELVDWDALLRRQPSRALDPKLVQEGKGSMSLSMPGKFGPRPDRATSSDRNGRQDPFSGNNSGAMNGRAMTH